MEQQEEDRLLGISEEQGSASQVLPDDMLASVLSRLAPRSLAVSRAVCKAWRALVDGRRLLRSDLLPLSMVGLFINYNNLPFAELFCRPCTKFNYCLPYTGVQDHCNGLLLLYNAVLNPATGQRVPLHEPPHPRKGMEHFAYDMYLVFDPTISSHFEVFSIPRFPDKDEPYTYDDYLKFGINNNSRLLDRNLLESEWPLSPCILDVFSSKKGRWEKRSFEREGEAAGTIASMQQDYLCMQRQSVYWQGALHVQCENDFIMRISLSNNVYQVIKPPRGICEYGELHLGRSENGVYYALLNKDRLQVWILEESRGQMDWILKYDSGHGLLVASRNCVQQVYGPWILLDINSGASYDKEELVDSKLEWSSDGDSVLQIEDSIENCYAGGYMEILGFHPYKEIVFLHRSLSRGLAYHLNSSKLEDLGNLCPKVYDINQHSFIETCFPYTPCRIGDSPESSK